MALNRPVTIDVLATDDVAVAPTMVAASSGATTLTLLLDAHGSATFTPSILGNWTVTATATNPAGKVGTTNSTLTVFDPTATHPPTASFDSPANSAIITAPTPVVGSVADTSSFTWTLSAIAQATGVVTQINSGTSSVSHATLGTFDPTMLPNGIYTLQLQAQDFASPPNVTTVTEAVQLSGALKLGNLHLSFTESKGQAS